MKTKRRHPPKRRTALSKPHAEPAATPPTTTAPSAERTANLTSPNQPPAQLTPAESTALRAPYDESRLERARTYWQFGEWARLAALADESLDQHPDRARLALFAAAGCQQLGQLDRTRALVRQALAWGCRRPLVSQILISGVYHGLGRAAWLADDVSKARHLLETAVDVLNPRAEARLWYPIRHALAEQELTAQRRAHQSLTAAAEARIPDWLHSLAENCLEQSDIHAAIDQAGADFSRSPTQLVQWYLTLSESFQARQDRLTAEHFANQARLALPEKDEGLTLAVVRRLIRVGRSDEAMALTMEHALKGSLIGEALGHEDFDTVQTAFQRSRTAAKASNQHGQALLLTYLDTHLTDYIATLDGRRPVLIEIGTTREEVSGQGSTRQLAEFCQRQGIDFITVDMDPHNTQMANQLFQRLGAPFQAVTMKGEDYLREFAGPIDFVFLDAYDFDHGGHSALRQSRYERFLGGRIDEQQCHQMHLECAQSLAVKLAPKGVICLDDTWRDQSTWTAKGTLAVPYLLEHGFGLLEARNRAALLARAAPVRSEEP